MDKRNIVPDPSWAQIPKASSLWDWLADPNFDLFLSLLRRELVDQFADSELAPDEVIRSRSGMVSLVANLQRMPRSYDDRTQSYKQQHQIENDPTE